jgi:long-chain acyl-CoA synthetase
LHASCAARPRGAGSRAAARSRPFTRGVVPGTLRASRVTVVDVIEAVETLATLFVETARTHPDRTFLRWCRGQERIVWTYGEAALRVASIVRDLDAVGATRGTCVVVYTAEMVPSILFDIACACAGVWFAPIETTSYPAVRALCDRTEARALLTTPDRKLDGPPTIAMDRRAAPTGSVADALALLGERAALTRPDDTYMLQPTSGTTGDSKLAMRPHSAMVRAARLLSCGTARNTDPAPRVLMVPALTHGMGQYLLSIGLLLGGEFCVTSRIDVDASLDEIRSLDPTHMAVTPRVLRSLFSQHGGLDNERPLFGPSARIMITSGAPPDKELLVAVARTGVDVIEGYGASEYSVVAMTRPGTWRPDILGHVLDDVVARLTDEGELHVRTPGMMHGYYRAPELTRAALTEDGLFRTGDRVTIGPDNEMRYIGRVVDSFNLFDGSHVAPAAIETAIAGLVWVDQAIMIGDQRPYLTGLVVPHPLLCGDPAVRALAARELGRINGSLPPNARVRRVALLGRAMPDEIYRVVGHGKVRRKRDAAIATYAEIVRALYEDGEAGDGWTCADVPGATERRASSRQPLRWLVRLAFEHGRLLLATRDVSRTGVSMETRATLEVGTPVRVEVIELEGASFGIDGSVARCDDGVVGIRWTSSSAELAARLPP